MVEHTAEAKCHITKLGELGKKNVSEPTVINLETN